jgi:hypothetical protein
MRRSVALLALTMACHTGGSRLSPATPTQLSLRVLGDVNPDSMPPSCRAHGGTPPVRSAPPIWVQGRQLDRHLDSLGAGKIFVHLVSARTAIPFATAVISLEPASPRALIAAYTANDGWAQIQAPARRYAMRVRSIGVAAILDSLLIRRGYADTLMLEVGQAWLCGL